MKSLWLSFGGSTTSQTNLVSKVFKYLHVVHTPSQLWLMWVFHIQISYPSQLASIFRKTREASTMKTFTSMAGENDFCLTPHTYMYMCLCTTPTSMLE